jgi:hypothetical protein
VGVYWELLKALPEILSLLQALQKGIKESQGEEATQRKVKDDLKQISEAFHAKDPEKLRAIFNN